MRFLYRDCKPHFNITNSHAGLWYDKFFDKWQPDVSVADEGKKDWINEVTGRRVGNREQLEQHISRLTHLLTYRQQTPLTLTLESNFVTGLGREHPVENGFAWHHTLATPYLPGSSVKGMVRAWAEQWVELGDGRAHTIKRIFGSEPQKKINHQKAATDQAHSEQTHPDQTHPDQTHPKQAVTPTQNSNQVGSVIFLDAIPKRPVQLKTDIMTPHYSPYYQDKTGKTPPADWHDPTPIPFLVVEKGETFAFGVMPRTLSDDDIADCETVKGWLVEALTWLGAGAKTAVGYGRFGEQAHQSEGTDPTRGGTTEPLSPLEEIVQKLLDTRDKQLPIRAQGYVDQLQRADGSDEEKRQAAQRMKTYLESRNVRRLNSLNAYQVLCKLVDES